MVPIQHQSRLGVAAPSLPPARSSFFPSVGPSRMNPQSQEEPQMTENTAVAELESLEAELDDARGRKPVSPTSLGSLR